MNTEDKRLKKIRHFKGSVKDFKKYWEDRLNEDKDMTISCGLVIIYEKTILLVHPTNGSWWKSYSIPKGKIEEDETFLKCARRETKEEIGIKVPKKLIDKTPKRLVYPNKNKVLYYFTVYIKDLSDLGLKSNKVNPKKLQKEEVDWAGFVDPKEAEKRLSPSMIPILNEIHIHENKSFLKMNNFLTEYSSNHLLNE